jgi:hypothetical protein
MQRQSIVAIAVIAAIVLAVGLFMKQGGGKQGDGNTIESRAFNDDSLGVRLRLPESPGWSLRREPPSADGRVLTAVHSGDRATVQLFSTPPQEGVDLEGIFSRRQAAVAQMFQVRSLDQVIARVMKDETQPINGRPYRQWQAITQPVEVPGGKPESICFMWLQTLRPTGSLECLGMVRFPAQATPEEQAEVDGLIRDVSYILQSFEVR